MEETMHKKPMNESVPAFTEEQIKILTIAFDTTWDRIKRFQEYIDGDEMRQAAVMKILHAKGVVTNKEVAVIDRIYAEASSLVKGDYGCADMLWPMTMESILRGEMVRAPILKLGPLEDVESEEEA